MSHKHLSTDTQYGSTFGCVYVFVLSQPAGVHGGVCRLRPASARLDSLPFKGRKLSLDVHRPSRASSIFRRLLLLLLLLSRRPDVSKPKTSPGRFQRIRLMFVQHPWWRVYTLCTFGLEDTTPWSFVTAVFRGDDLYQLTCVCVCVYMCVIGWNRCRCILGEALRVCVAPVWTRRARKIESLRGL